MRRILFQVLPFILVDIILDHAENQSEILFDCRFIAFLRIVDLLHGHAEQRIKNVMQDCSDIRRFISNDINLWLHTS